MLLFPCSWWMSIRLCKPFCQIKSREWYTIATNTNGVLKALLPQGDVTQGHFEVDQVATDPASNMLIYVQPSENQRARMVTQMIMQDIQVFIPGHSLSRASLPLILSNTAAAGGPTPTPLPANQTQAAPVIVRPDIITVMVSPQDAVTLTYLIYSGADDYPVSSQSK